VVVLHSILESALKKRPSLQPFKLRSYLEIPFWFRLPLLYGNSKRLRYLLLGASVQEQICKKFPKLRPFTGVIDIPCFYKEPAAFTPFEHRTIRFASLGVGVKDKGIDLFFRLAKDLQELKSQYRAEFVHIGPLGRKIACLKNEFVQIPSGDTVLSRNDYDRHIASIDYVVLLHKPDAYKVSPSATIFDAFSHLKPIVAMQNPFFEHYFEQMGDIGYLCADYNKVKSVVKYIICETPLQQYLKQREAISKGREMLNIAELARKIKSAW
jgi:glycosyltransferase involved in cell wall biosynthesis